MALSALLLAPLLGPAAPPPAPDVRESVVKIFSQSRPPDPARPWSKRPPTEVFGTGLVIDGHRILTNAHVVSYASQVFVQPYQSSDKLAAHVAARAPGIDLALLELEDPAFFGAHPALAFADRLPDVAEKVSVLGYPVGGDALSTTEGIVSRIEFAPYYEGVRGLRIQVDAALNPGNSGGPALIQDRVVGVVFSGIKDAQSIGYLIPVEEIQAFLTDIGDGSYTGRPTLFGELQTLENTALRKKLGLSTDETGLMVTHPSAGNPDIERWDVLTKIGDYAIDNAGMISAGKNLRLDFRYLVPKLASAPEGPGTVPMTLLRGGKPLPIEAHVAPRRDRLLKWLDDAYPSYFVYGPLVFTPVHADHIGLLSFAQEYLIQRHSPILHRAGEDVRFPGEQLVMIPTPLLPHRIAKGYDLGFFSVLRSVNGVEIKNLRHLVETLDGLRDEHVVFEWLDEDAEILVFDRREILAATEEILEDNGIRSQMSPDLRDAWNGGS